MSKLKSRRQITPVTRAFRSIKIIFSLHRSFTHFEVCLIYLNVSLLRWSARIRLRLGGNKISWLKRYMSCIKTRIIWNFLKVGHLRTLKWRVADTLKKPPRPSKPFYLFGFAFFNSRQFVENLAGPSSIPQGASQSSVTNILCLTLVDLEQKNRIKRQRKRVEHILTYTQK